MALQSAGPYMRDGVISRSEVWRLRYDLRDLYDKYENDFTLEPLCPWTPFGAMRFEDTEIELHDHLRCSHLWNYSHWTWLHSAATDTGFFPTGGALYPVAAPSSAESVQLLAQYAAGYQGPADVR